MKVLSDYKDMFPSETDINGARTALLRLQETFALSTKQIAEGIAEDSPPLSKLGKPFLITTYLNPEISSAEKSVML